MGRKIIIYTGAPDSSALDWGNSELLTEFSLPIAQFARLAPAPGTDDGPLPFTPSPSAPNNYAAWRSLSLDKAHIPTGFSQQYAIEFFNTSFQHPHVGDEGETTAELSHFYEESYAAHQQQPPTSQLVLSEELDFSITTTASFNTDENTSFISNASIRGPLLVGNAGTYVNVNNLRDIPSPSYLLAIQPQTMTCNLIVGLISLSQPRTVKTRYGSSHRLVEALVGDDTRAGFSITFWLPDSTRKAGTDTLADTLTALRPADIILLQNVALNVFSKRVYGYSLRRGLTRAHLLYRTQVDAEDVGGHYRMSDLRSSSEAGTMVHPQLEKTRRVYDWVVRFVGQGVRSATKTSESKAKKKEVVRGGARAWDVMPDVDETQLHGM